MEVTFFFPFFLSLFLTDCLRAQNVSITHHHLANNKQSDDLPSKMARVSLDQGVA